MRVFSLLIQRYGMPNTVERKRLYTLATEGGTLYSSPTPAVPILSPKLARHASFAIRDIEHWGENAHFGSR